MWVAAGLGGPFARKFVRTGLAHDDASVRHAALHAVALHRDKDALGYVKHLLGDANAHTVRGAAEALGRIGDKSATPLLLEALAKPHDRVLEHSLIYALIEIGDAEGIAKGLAHENSRVRRGALIALDGIKTANLKPETVAKELSASDAALKEAAWWIAGRHPEWGGQLAGFLRERLVAKDLKKEERAELVAQLARFSGTPAVQTMLAEKVRDVEAGDARLLALQAMAQSSLKESPAPWLEAVAQALGEAVLVSWGESPVVPQAVATAPAYAQVNKRRRS